MNEQLMGVLSEYNNEINDNGHIIVIKGFRLDGIIDRTVNMDEILKNKFIYFAKLQHEHIKVITFDEYIALYDFIIAQYNKVVIIDNNLYYNFYPLNIEINGDILQSLDFHYDSELAENTDENNTIKPYLDIYSNIMKVNGSTYITYNQLVRDEKELLVGAFNLDEKVFEVEAYDETSKTFDIVDEVDYLIFFDLLLNGNEQNIQIVKSNIGIESKELFKKITIINYLYPDVKIKFVKKDKEDTYRSVHPDLTKILKDYWDADSFRDVLVYDLDSIYEGKKEIEKIKQSDVITHIVEEVEKCREGEAFRDVFVTASTGAGKSAMFQIPSIYLAEKYQLFTIVISPLIGLMKDQVVGLESKGYKYSRTINSDISPIKKQDIINEIAEGECHILYISPESLMSKSDLIHFIGPRKLGLLVIDEAHIVTTWGKQFRPDYWYLGDHIMKLRRVQQKREGMQFVIATFTATAIFGGLENMYQETIQSLHMIDPITYLGYVRRDDITINIEKAILKTNKSEYELDKFEQLLLQIKRSIILDKKMLIYFPTVALIERFYDHCKYRDIDKYVARYHGKLQASIKEENYMQFRDKEKHIMIATKAFGMGIDINDIETIMHFAPTGNVCDYVQEIGRAARKTDLDGDAYYQFMSNDFKHINRLHGLSTIKKYQLIEVIKKVYQLHNENLQKKDKFKLTKKRNEMLVDAESFAHIFENPFFDEDDGINKVKTAMLLIQKDFERTMSYSPFYVRPIPLFEIGFFNLNEIHIVELNRKYNNAIAVIDKENNIYNVNLRKIWEKSFDTKYSFPKFKYMLYTKDQTLSFDYIDDFDPALKIDITLIKDHRTKLSEINESLKSIVNDNVREGGFIELNEIVNKLIKTSRVSKYQAKNIVDITISAMRIYSKEYSKLFNSNMYSVKVLKSGDIKYSFKNVTTSYFNWLVKILDIIENKLDDGVIYLTQGGNNKLFNEYLLVLGVLESYEILSFKALGGRNSQLYIYVNQTKTMKEIISKPNYYKNTLLELVELRHTLSVLMLTFLFDNDFTSDEIWDYIEDYFVGNVPLEVSQEYEKQTGTKLLAIK